MKQILPAIIVGLVVAFLLCFCNGCSTSTLVKECKKVQDEETYKCKTMKPWE